jgi:ADP-heptose:LPS heptosyltransferase
MSTGSGQEKKSKILLVAITRLGDLLQATPTIAGLKREHPGCHITVVVDRTFAQICCGLPGVDDVYEMDLSLIVQLMRRQGEGLVESYGIVESLVEDLKSRDFDYCLNISSSGYTALLLRMLEIKDSRGWMTDDEGCRVIANPWARLFAAFVHHSNRHYNGINLVDITRCCAGVKQHPLRLKYNIPREAADFGKKFLAGEKISGSGPLLCMQVGASQEKRQWSPARFARLAKLLIDELDARIVLTGTKAELGVVSEVPKLLPHPNMAVAAGRTNLGQLASLLAEADLLITGDTGPMHLAIAVDTPVVALFVASAFCFETGPYGEGNLVVQSEITCHPCNPNFPCSRTDCHDQISPELMAKLVKLRLELTPAEILRTKITPDVADPRQAAVYVSEFDEDHFLTFRQLNGITGKLGFPAGYFEAARAAYKRLWKEEFEMLLDPEGNRLDLPDGVQATAGIPQILVLVEHALAAMEELKALIRDTRSPARRLGEVGNLINDTDVQIEDIGLRHAVLGALVRMFIMEKENLQGTDPLRLASDTEEIYRSLGRRAIRFAALFAASKEKIQEAQSWSTSSSTARHFPLIQETSAR